MDFHVLTIFPEAFASFLQASLLGKAIARGAVRVRLWDVRDFADNRHASTDDVPYGGGSGMVMKPEPLVACIEAVRAAAPGVRVALMTPAGAPLSQPRVRAFAAGGPLALCCGRYEGVDERVVAYVDEELSIGDYVLSGGEVGAMAVIDAVARLCPGVLGNAGSLDEESHAQGALEYPQYTRPPSFRGVDVPPALLSGDHARIRRWRRRQALVRTRERRPDLFAKIALTKEDRKALEGDGDGE